VFNAPSAGSEFKQKRCVIFFMFRKRSASIGDNVEFAFVVSLAEHAAKATLVLVIAGSGVNNEGIRPIVARVVNNWFRTESSTEFIEGAKSSRGKRAAPPNCVLASEYVKRRRHK
jgi:hypothetical protein